MGRIKGKTKTSGLLAVLVASFLWVVGCLFVFILDSLDMYSLRARA